MSKAFTKEGEGGEEDGPEEADSLPPNIKNYMTPPGFKALQDEMRQLQRVERPKIVEVVSWAAGNGDRSENGDYIYGKKRLREIDRRLRYLSKRIESAEIVNPAQQKGLEQVFFGATVTYLRAGKENSVKLVGVDEADLTQGKISWISPLARALMKARPGDTVELRAPGGAETLELLDVQYKTDA
jgi:transcription elongation factor GreB